MYEKLSFFYFVETFDETYVFLSVGCSGNSRKAVEYVSDSQVVVWHAM